MDNSKGNRKTEIVFFDLETTAPSPEGRWWLLEFGAILVCPRKLVEVGSYDTLIRPGDLSAVSRRFTDVESIASAPTFHDVADKIFDILDGTPPPSWLPPPPPHLLAFLVRRDHVEIVTFASCFSLFPL